MILLRSAHHSRSRPQQSSLSSTRLRVRGQTFPSRDRILPVRGKFLPLSNPLPDSGRALSRRNRQSHSSALPPLPAPMAFPYLPLLPGTFVRAMQTVPMAPRRSSFTLFRLPQNCPTEHQRKRRAVCQSRACRFLWARWNGKSRTPFPRPWSIRLMVHTHAPFR